MNLKAVAPAIGLATVLALVPTTNASAARSTFADDANDTASRSDIRWVRVANSREHNRFAVHIKMDRIVLGTFLVVFVDRNLNNKGPELRMVAHPDSEWSLYRVGKWGQRGERIDTCGQVHMSPSKRDIASWTAKRGCLHIDGRVRVAAKMVDTGDGRDWAPSSRNFYPAVSAKY